MRPGGSPEGPERSEGGAQRLDPAGLIAGGVLLATLWADTPVAESLTFTPLRGGGSLGASFGF